MARTCLVTCILLLALPACDDGGGASDHDAAVTPPRPDGASGVPDGGASVDASPGGRSLAKICNPTDGYVVRLQAKLEECAAHTVPELLPGGLSQAETAAFCEGAAAAYLADGTLALADEERFSACEAYLATLSCESWSPINPCSALFVGQVAAGQTCFDHLQCVPGQACTGPASGTFCRTCAAPRATGQPCGVDRECASGYCTCHDGNCQGVCEELAAGSAPGASCDPFSGRCAGAYACRMSATGEDVCALNPTTSSVDQPCRVDLDCGDKHTGRFCKNVAAPGMSPTYRCRPYVALDATCVPGIDKCNPFLGHRCVPDGVGGNTCEVPAPAGLGMSCYAEKPCGTDLVCDPLAFVCKNARRAGEVVAPATDLCTAGTHPVVPLEGPTTCEYSNRRDMCSPVDEQ